MAQLAGGDDALRQTVAFARRLSAGSAAPPAEPGRPLRSIFANLQADGVKGDANRYWPAMYLIDKAGNLRYLKIGEGQYEQTEAVIQALLAEGL